MDQSTLNVIGGAIMACLGWFARTLYFQVQAHGKELADFRVEVARDYVPNETMTRVLEDVRSDLRYIRGRIDETPPARRHGDPK